MDLLQATGEVVNGMDDVHFNMKDVIYIVMKATSRRDERSYRLNEQKS
jgi:hypothetical protein